jgi:hypothetical protein
MKRLLLLGCASFALIAATASAQARGINASKAVRFRIQPKLAINNWLKTPLQPDLPDPNTAAR